MKKQHPPKFGFRLLNLVSDADLAEDLLGDLHETYLHDVESKGYILARLNYSWHVFSLLFSYALKYRKRNVQAHAYSATFSLAMIKNYLKVSIRNLYRYKFFSLINVFGLSTGLAISLLLVAVISDVTDYDKFHENKEEIYRITTRVKDADDVNFHASTPQQLKAQLDSLPGIQHVVQLDKSLNGEVVLGKKSIPMKGFFVDRGFLDVFTFPLIQGNKENVLLKPTDILLTEAAVYRLFGENEAMGQQVEIEPYGLFTVVGILADHPKKSHIQFDMIAPLSRAAAENIPSKSFAGFSTTYTYFQAEELSQLVTNRLGSVASTINVANPERSVDFIVEALSDITLGREYRNSIGPEWDLLSMTIFGLMAFFILAPACFNYANISIARALKRSKEIGIRRVVGSGNKQIITQFVIETVLVCFVAFFIAFVIFFYLRDAFLAQLAPASSSGLSLLITPKMLLLFISFVLITGAIIGLIPALHFSKIKTLKALKAQSDMRKSKATNWRNVLMILQFAISLGFTMTVFIFLEQYRFASSFDIGFKKDNILNVKLMDQPFDRILALYDNQGRIDGISFSSGLLGTPGMSKLWVHQTNDSILVDILSASANFIPNHNIALLAGHNISQTVNFKSNEVLINKAFANQLGYDQPIDAIGRELELDSSELFVIVGVTEDVNHVGLREKIQPFIIRSDPENWMYANLVLSDFESAELIPFLEELETKWEQLSEIPFEATFLDDDLEESYKWFVSFVRIVAFLGFLAITVSCLGLLGMVVFQVENRTKEIGIRKTLGASTVGITYQLSKKYLIFMVLAAFIAVPITYALFNSILPHIQFYHSEISIWTILLSTLMVLTFGMSTVASQTIKAARTNPADTLRYE